VQLAYHPAALVDRRSPLEDPLFDPRGGPDSLLPRGDLPDALAGDLAALRTRVRNAHNDQLLAKLRAVLQACRAWGVRLVVLPEYSVPWEILGGVADAAGEMVVVAVPSLTPHYIGSGEPMPPLYGLCQLSISGSAHPQAMISWPSASSSGSVEIRNRSAACPGRRTMASPSHSTTSARIFSPSLSTT
jgi:hypothetical protein